LGDTVALHPVKDNTLFEDPIGTVSSGAGNAVFAGRTGSNGGGWKLRALVKWDVAAAVPAGSVITSASLKMTLIAEHSAGHTVTVHKVLADWGEAGSNGFGGNGDFAQPGDVTWLQRFFPDTSTNWLTPGGEFSPTISTSRIVGPGLATFTWNSTPQTIADVQAWLDDPATNFGWMLKGNEATLTTAKKFASREYEVVSKRPTLTIIYTPPVQCPSDIAPSGEGDGIVNADDLLAVINAWSLTGERPEDVTGNNIVDVDDLLAVINAWGPCE
jgi:hypothetical protein